MFIYFRRERKFFGRVNHVNCERTIDKLARWFYVKILRSATRQNSHLRVDASVLVVFQFRREPPLIFKRHRGLDNHRASKVKHSRTRFHVPETGIIHTRNSRRQWNTWIGCRWPIDDGDLVQLPEVRKQRRSRHSAIRKNINPHTCKFDEFRTYQILEIFVKR